MSQWKSINFLLSIFWKKYPIKTFLFRLTAGASKVKRLRAEIEAGHAFINNIDGKFI